MSTVRFYLGFQWDSLKSSSSANTILGPLFTASLNLPIA